MNRDKRALAWPLPLAASIAPLQDARPKALKPPSKEEPPPTFFFLSSQETGLPALPPHPLTLRCTGFSSSSTQLCPEGAPGKSPGASSATSACDRNLSSLSSLAGSSQLFSLFKVSLSLPGDLRSVLLPSLWPPPCLPRSGASRKTALISWPPFRHFFSDLPLPRGILTQVSSSPNELVPLCSESVLLHISFSNSASSLVDYWPHFPNSTHCQILSLQYHPLSLSRMLNVCSCSPLPWHLNSPPRPQASPLHSIPCRHLRVISRFAPQAIVCHCLAPKPAVTPIADKFPAAEPGLKLFEIQGSLPLSLYGHAL